VCSKLRSVDAEFFDLEVYAMYKAAHELLGERTWRMVWRSGEIVFEELEGRLNVRGDDVLVAIKKIADYLQKVGYVKHIRVREVKEDEFEYEMKDSVIIRGTQRLIGEGAVPAHISTTVMLAMLKKIFGLKATLIGEPIFHEDGRAVERWRLTRITETPDENSLL